MNNDAPTYTIAEYVKRWATIEEQSSALEGLALLDRLALCEGRDPGFTDHLLDELGPEGCAQLGFDRFAWLRPKQIAVLRATALIILFIAGRRMGKTQTATEWIVDRVERGARELVIIGPTYDDVKQFMVGGHKKRVDGVSNGSGLLDLLPPWMRFDYKEDEGVIEFDHAVLRLHSGEVPEYRGPGPDSVWGDEIIKWRHPKRLLENLRHACQSVGKVPPQILLTTSPKRSLRLLRDLVMHPDVLTITGRMEENRGNINEGTFQSLKREFGGTRKGDEELDGKLGVEEEGAVFSMTAIDNGRLTEGELAPDLERIVVAVDPAVSQHRKSDPTGINVSGRAGDIHSGHGYVLDDKTGKYGWDEWGDIVWKLVRKWGASAIVVERDKIGDAGKSNIAVAAARAGYEKTTRPGSKSLVDYVHKQNRHRVQLVEVLTRGVDKASRAEPVANMYTPTEHERKGRIHHVGHLTELESEMTEWDPTSGVSPNAMDALVHAITELFQLDRATELDGRAAMKGFSEANAQLAGRAPRAPVETPPTSSGSGAQRPSIDREWFRRGGYGGRLIG